MPLQLSNFNKNINPTAIQHLLFFLCFIAFVETIFDR